MNIEFLELALRMLATYGQVLVSLVFLLAAGILLARTKSVPTAMFFGGLLVTTLVSIGIRVMIEYRLFDTNGDLQSQIQIFSIFGFVAMLIQVLGFLLYVLSLPIPTLTNHSVADQRDETQQIL